MALDATDQYDIQRAFEVMDEEKTNRISMPNFHILYLGLGFQPKQRTLQELRDKVVGAIAERKEGGVGWNAEDLELFDAEVEGDESCIPLSLVLEVLAQHSRDRANEMDKCFQLVDSDNKGYIEAEDLQRLSNEAGEPIGVEEAKALILASGEIVDSQGFQRFFAPPSP